MNDKSQTNDGYKCSCGYVAENKSDFLTHLGQGARKDGKGVHSSEGRVNLITGEITMPPWNQRTKEQRDESTFGKKERQIGKDGKVYNARTTDILAQASEVRFIPRIFTTTYTPIMHQAQDAATRYFGWPENLPFEDFLDTVIYKYFKEHGIHLGQYGVDDTLLNKGEPDVESQESISNDKQIDSEDEELELEGVSGG